MVLLARLAPHKSESLILQIHAADHNRLSNKSTTAILLPQRMLKTACTYSNVHFSRYNKATLTHQQEEKRRLDINNALTRAADT